MDIRTISATLAILGTGLTLSACKKGADATEVPASAPAAADGSCGADKGHGHASCGGDKAADGEKSCSSDKAEKSCGGDKAEKSCGGEKSCGAKGDGSCGGEKAPPSTAAAEPVSQSPTVAADASKPAATTKTKTKTKTKKKAEGEAACGEGTCA